ncbi:hypothetical protein [Paraburkholderia elongata]|uniref:Uncharacterized protein n=1 Tax=Paraburkholderia elongata TaxID=2675747 RepID=A0A972SLG0_9BURK|nr:hypothetical protein [Paraburkholderia elongata]NPT59097.1 hypothetical protein [Paraburkholderia elongata]
MATQESTITLKKNNDVPSNATVTVASKFPMDFTLRLFDFVKRYEPVMGGGQREFKIAEPRHGSKDFIVQGNSWPQNKGPHQQINCGYAITHGIPKAFWDEWLEQNRESAFVVNGMLFAHAETASTMAEAKEKEKEKSGLERLDPKNLPKGIETADEMRRAS